MSRVTRAAAGVPGGVAVGGIVAHAIAVDVTAGVIAAEIAGASEVVVVAARVVVAQDAASRASRATRKSLPT